MLQLAKHQGGTLLSHFQEVFKYLVASSVHSHVRDLESEGINEGTDPTWFLIGRSGSQLPVSPTAWLGLAFTTNPPA